MKITKRQLRRLIREALGNDTVFENTPQNRKNIIDAYIEDVGTTDSDEVNESDLYADGPGAQRLIQVLKPIWLASTGSYLQLEDHFMNAVDEAVEEAFSAGRLTGPMHDNVDGWVGAWVGDVLNELEGIWGDAPWQSPPAGEEEPPPPTRKKRSSKKPTKSQWQSVLNAMTKSYGNSYAMMVDDAMIGFSKRASKLNLADTYDGAVFSFLFQKVKNFEKTLSAQDIQTLNDLFEQDEY